MRYIYCIFIILMICTGAKTQAQDLDHYLNTAQNSSPLLKDLNNQIASGTLDSLRLRAGLRPQVTGNGMGTYAPVIGGVGYASAITNGQTLSALVGVNQTIVNKNYLSAQLDALKLSKDSLGNSIRLSQQDLKKAITTQYI